MDVFGSWYSIPFHLTTTEAAQRMSAFLVFDGVLIVNVISSLYGPRSGVFHGIYAALESVFQRLLIFPASAPDPKYALARQNLMIVAFHSSKRPNIPPAPEILQPRFHPEELHHFIEMAFLMLLGLRAH